MYNHHLTVNITKEIVIFNNYVGKQKKTFLVLVMKQYIYIFIFMSGHKTYFRQSLEKNTQLVFS